MIEAKIATEKVRFPSSSEAEIELKKAYTKLKELSMLVDKLEDDEETDGRTMGLATYLYRKAKQQYDCCCDVYDSIDRFEEETD